jgi:hypothetical protein
LDPFFFDEFQERIVSSHSQKCGEFPMGHSLFTVFHEAPHSLLEVAMLGEPSRFPDPETPRIKFRNFVDGQELSGLIVARMVTVFVESTKYG